MTPRVSVLIVNYNAGARLQRCLDALAVQRMTDFDAWVGDNGSTDASFKDLRLPDARFHKVDFAQNLGFAAANNRLAKMANAPWLATLNPDAYAEPDWLSEILQVADGAPAHCAAIGSTQLLAADPTFLDGAGDVMHVTGFPWRGGQGKPARVLEKLPAVYSVFSPCGAAALWRSALFLEEGGFDEAFFCYGEDVELAGRLRLRGFEIWQARAAKVRHEGGGAGGGASDFARFHGTRNRFWGFVQMMPPLLFWPMLPLHLLLTFGLILAAGQKKIRLAGIRAALKDWRRVWRRRQEIMMHRTTNSRTFYSALSYCPSAPPARAIVMKPIKIKPIK